MHFIEAKGCRIPAVGLGTWQLSGRDCVRIIEQAIKLGYRHFDTAQMYGNEREVGEGVRASGIKREEVFVVTKVAPDNLAPRQLERSVKESIGHLRLGEIDLLLLHWPNKGVPLKDTIDALCTRRPDPLPDAALHTERFQFSGSHSSPGADHEQSGHQEHGRAIRLGFGYSGFNLGGGNVIDEAGAEQRGISRCEL
jgi:predicted oxidoreductase